MGSVLEQYRLAVHICGCGGVEGLSRLTLEASSHTSIFFIIIGETATSTLGPGDSVTATDWY
jgi:hypothetical protein